jgi:CRISPR system Cascade subunit CasA
MTNTYNLLHEKWIPCQLLDGSITTVNIYDALTHAHEARAITSSFGTEKVAIYRLLLAVLHRVFGPSSHSEWQKMWDKGRFDKESMEKYCALWEERFDLLHGQHPFYQTTKIVAEPRPISGYSFHLGLYHIASGNNATLFDHHTENGMISLSPAEAARMLITAQSFSFGFRNFKDGPSSRGVNFLLEGKNFFQSLLLNMVLYSKERPFPILEKDLPAWEREDAFEPDRAKPDGYLDYLTWQSRKVLLHADETDGRVKVVQVDNGLKLDVGKEPYTKNPMMLYEKVEKPINNAPPLRPLKFQEGRALWRDSTAILETNPEEGDAPKSLQEINNYKIDQNRLRLQSIGISSDQGKVNFYQEELFAFPKEYLGNNILVSQLKTCLSQAKEVRDKLWGAVNRLAEMILSPDANFEEGHKADKNDKQQLMDHIFAENVFWSSLESHFYQLLNDLAADGTKAMDTWQDTLKKCAWHAYEHASDFVGTSPQALKAAALGGRMLGFGLTKVFKE